MSWIDDFNGSAKERALEIARIRYPNAASYRVYNVRAGRFNWIVDVNIVQPAPKENMRHDYVGEPLRIEMIEELVAASEANWKQRWLELELQKQDTPEWILEYAGEMEALI